LRLAQLVFVKALAGLSVKARKQRGGSTDLAAHSERTAGTFGQRICAEIRWAHHRPNQRNRRPTAAACAVATIAAGAASATAAAGADSIRIVPKTASATCFAGAPCMRISATTRSAAGRGDQGATIERDHAVPAQERDGGSSAGSASARIASATTHAAGAAARTHTGRAIAGAGATAAAALTREANRSVAA
jgi:hypothetical protein